MQGNPSIGGVKRKRGSKIERCHVGVSHLLIGFLSVLLCSAINTMVNKDLYKSKTRDHTVEIYPYAIHETALTHVYSSFERP